MTQLELPFHQMELSALKVTLTRYERVLWELAHLEAYTGEGALARRLAQRELEDTYGPDWAEVQLVDRSS